MTIEVTLKQMANQPEKSEELLEEMMNAHSIQSLVDHLLIGIEFPMLLYRLLLETGLADQESTPERNFFMALSEYILSFETSRIEKAYFKALQFDISEVEISPK